MTPAMSVIVVTPDRYATVERCIRHLRAQTVRDQLELVIVAPSLAALDARPAHLSDFRWVHLIEVGPITSVAQARAAGIRQARAPVVALTEDHCYPAPGWAAALIAAHQGPWAGVGPAIGNANPGTVSWANLFIQYGRWVAPVAAGTVDDIPGHNSAYKRDVLLAYGDRLADLLEAETVLHGDLQAHGHRLYLAADARVDHLNMTRPLSFLTEQVTYGQLFAGTRAEAWSWRRRVLYVAGAPLIPLVRLRRILGHARRAGRGRHIPAMLPALLAGLSASAVGEAAGYATGLGDAPARMGALEFHRERHLTAADRSALDGRSRPLREPA
jgi:glycosyltransferase involved in cell wall biosynthesis